MSEKQKKYDFMAEALTKLGALPPADRHAVLAALVVFFEAEDEVADRVRRARAGVRS